jgi:hypothetical protein
MKIIKCWKKLSHEDGYLNDSTVQTVVVSRKEFSNNYHVQLFECGKTGKDEGKTISPDYATKVKADAFAVDWMKKHPNGTV